MASNTSDISLVVFTCSGREHLLPETMRSFYATNNLAFGRVILAIDGQVDAGVIDMVKPDMVIQSPRRKGYVNSIANTLRSIDTPFFFWLEDDWRFEAAVDLEALRSQLAQHKDWAQIVYSKYGPLTAEMKADKLFDNFYANRYGFSANPCLCRTELLQGAFKTLLSLRPNERGDNTGFENFLTDHFNSSGAKMVILDPVDHEMLAHAGDFESTGREYHMINSVDATTASLDRNYISGLTRGKNITLYNKVAMLAKVWYAATVLSFSLFKHRHAYDFAFRLYSAYLKKFRN